MTAMKTTKTALAKELGVARSTLYYKSKKPPRDAERKKEIETVMKKHPAYGHRRIAIQLKWNRKLVIRIMNKFGLKPRLRRKRRQPFKPDDVSRPATEIRNMPRWLCPIQSNVIWAGDFTYLWWGGRFWYVATVIDIYTREIIGWHTANHHTTALITAAFLDAVKRTGKTPIWFHSDQGSEYVSGIYLTLLAAHGVSPSHSKKGSPWHNGYQESWYSNFKLELEAVSRFNTIGELIEAVYQRIHYYNTERIHTSLSMAPMEFRMLLNQKTAVPAVG